MAFADNYPARVFTMRNGAADPLHIIAKGRDRWALEALIAAVSKDCTPINNPAPRWSARIHKLCKAGISIETISENHSGPFAGHHARYVLTCNVAAGCEGGSA